MSSARGKYKVRNAKAKDSTSSQSTEGASLKEKNGQWGGRKTLLWKPKETECQESWSNQWWQVQRNDLKRWKKLVCDGHWQWPEIYIFCNESNTM